MNVVVGILLSNSEARLKFWLSIAAAAATAAAAAAAVDSNEKRIFGGGVGFGEVVLYLCRALEQLAGVSQ